MTRLDNDPETILARGTVELEDGPYEVDAAVTAEEGRFLAGLVQQVRPQVLVEIGLACGISALFIQKAMREQKPLREAEQPFRHIVLDPLQSTWDHVGTRVLAREGAVGVEFFERGSEFVLPDLLAQGVVADMVFIDGWHTFDHALVDFFYATRLLRIGGVVVFDDANWPSVARVVSHALTYPCYRPFARFQGRPLMRRIAASVAGRSLARLSPSMVALQKIAADERGWDWDRRF